MFDYNFGLWQMAFLGGASSARSKKQMRKLQESTLYSGELAKKYNTALSIFKWEGLPENINELFVEQALLNTARVAMIKTDKYGLVLLPFSDLDSVNLYGQNTGIRLYGRNGESFTGTPYMEGAANEMADCVRMYDNPMRFPYFNYVFQHAEWSSQLKSSLLTASNKLKNPYVFIGDQSEKAQIERAVKAATENEPVLIFGNSLSQENLFRTEDVSLSTDVIQSLKETIDYLEGDYLETLGINANENIDKEERLLVDEVNANNEAINFSIESRLRAREVFCEQCNDMFGLNMSVRLRKDIMKEEAIELEEEVEVEDYDEDVQ